MSLVQELIKPLLEEDVREIAVYGGGFKQQVNLVIKILKF